MVVNIVCLGVPVADLTHTDETVLKENEYLLVTGCFLKYIGDSSLLGFFSIPQYQM